MVLARWFAYRYLEIYEAALQAVMRRKGITFTGSSSSTAGVPVSSGAVPQMSACSRCRAVQYCSQECQGAHWKHAETPHKVACRKR